MNRLKIKTAALDFKSDLDYMNQSESYILFLGTVQDFALHSSTTSHTTSFIQNKTYFQELDFWQVIIQDYQPMFRTPFEIVKKGGSTSESAWLFCSLDWVGGRQPFWVAFVNFSFHLERIRKEASIWGTIYWSDLQAALHVSCLIHRNALLLPGALALVNYFLDTPTWIA